jgi:hypothetical protein
MRPDDGEPNEVVITPALKRLLSWCRKMAKRDGKVCPWVFANEDATGHIVEIDGVWNRLRVRIKLFDRKGVPARIHDLRHFVGDTGTVAARPTLKLVSVMEKRMPLPACVG